MARPLLRRVPIPSPQETQIPQSLYTSTTLYPNTQQQKHIPSSQYRLPHHNQRHFSTSPPHPQRQHRISAIRRTGLRQKLEVHKYPLPKPVLDPKWREKVKVDEDHGLWGFFTKDKKAFNPPSEEAAFGRSWTVAELGQKSWDDLWALWWVCAKELNRIATSDKERALLKGFGRAELEMRANEVRKTQKNIKKALLVRWDAWHDARVLAMDDPTIEVSEEDYIYDPSKG